MQNMIDWSNCPYNYEAHIRELEKIKNGEVTDHNNNNYFYHKSRIDRCWAWHYSRNKKYVLLMHNSLKSIKPYHIETLEKYKKRSPSNKSYELFGIYDSEGLALTAMKQHQEKYLKTKIKTNKIKVKSLKEYVKANEVYVDNTEPKYTLRQLRGAWAAGRNNRG